MKRKSTGTRARFEVLKRDGFKCRYCGATPVDVLLHVDHVIAVANGGTDDPANLITACRRCNMGKSAVPLDRSTLPSVMSAEEQREHAKQIREYLKAQREVVAARTEVRDEIVRYWNEHVGDLYARGASALTKAVAEFGLVATCEAIDIVARRDLRGGDGPIRYFCGIMRKRRESAAAAAAVAPVRTFAYGVETGAMRVLDDVWMSLSSCALMESEINAIRGAIANGVAYHELLGMMARAWPDRAVDQESYDRGVASFVHAADKLSAEYLAIVNAEDAECA